MSPGLSDSRHVHFITSSSYTWKISASCVELSTLTIWVTRSVAHVAGSDAQVPILMVSVPCSSTVSALARLNRAESQEHVLQYTST